MTNRRQFLSHLSMTPFWAKSRELGGVATPSSAEEEAWLNGLTGKHRQFFDTASLSNGAPLTRVLNFFEAYAQAYRLKNSDVNAIMGIHGTALPLVLGDDLWRRFQLGRRNSVLDRSGKAPALSNIFADGSAQPTVQSLQAMGVRFLACRQTIARMAKDLEREGLGTSAELRSDIERGLLPQITPVPAMVVAANRAQEAGLSYLALG